MWTDITVQKDNASRYYSKECLLPLYLVVIHNADYWLWSNAPEVQHVGNLYNQRRMSTFRQLCLLLWIFSVNDNVFLCWFCRLIYSSISRSFSVDNKGRNVCFLTRCFWNWGSHSVLILFFRQWCMTRGSETMIQSWASIVLQRLMSQAESLVLFQYRQICHSMDAANSRRRIMDQLKTALLFALLIPSLLS